MNATEQYQRSFAAHLRNPDINPTPQGVDAKRIGVYTELLFNNVEDFLSGCFPVLRSLLHEAQWSGLVRQFYSEHACQTPYFREIPAEFVQWLSNASLPPTLPPFTLELAHYEWVEIPLILDPSDINQESVDLEGDLLDGQLVLNPVMLLQSYQFPVHKIGSDYQPKSPEPTHLLLLRNRQNKVEFVVLNAVTARLVQLLQDGLSGRMALQQISQEIQHPDPIQLLQYGLQLLSQLTLQSVLLGTVPTQR